MRIGYISDLHVEFRKPDFIEMLTAYLNSFKNEVDFLIIAGDIYSDSKRRKRFLESLELPIKTIMGNHDFFKTEVFDDFWGEDGIVGACLWTNFNNNPLSEYDAAKWIWDFKYIPNWTTAQCKFLHEKQLQAILDSPSEIVVTHFTPSKQSNTEKFLNDPHNDYFCNSLEGKILESNKKLWIHGHVHSHHD